MNEWHQTYMIFGSWIDRKPNYEVSKWRDTPRHSLNWIEWDDNWVDVKLPREGMRRFEVINYLHELHPNCYHSWNGHVIDNTITVTFRKLPEESVNEQQ